MRVLCHNDAAQTTLHLIPAPSALTVKIVKAATDYCHENELFDTKEQEASNKRQFLVELARKKADVSFEKTGRGDNHECSYEEVITLARHSQFHPQAHQEGYDENVEEEPYTVAPI